MTTNNNSTIYSLVKAGAALSLAAALFISPVLGGALEASARSYIAETEVTDSAQNGIISMAPGEKKTVEVKLKNRSDFTWSNEGSGYISLYTHGPKYRESLFEAGEWMSESQVARIKEGSVSPGETATVEVVLMAPSKEGAYSEVFLAASESFAWLDGGRVEMTIEVGDDVSEKVKEETASKVVNTVENGPAYLADIVLVDPQTAKLKAGQSFAVNAVLKNTGDRAWQSVQLVSTSSLFESSEWNGSVVGETAQTVKSGETVVVSAVLVAPDYNGEHEVELKVAANGTLTTRSFIVEVDVQGASQEMDDLDAEDYALELNLESSVSLIEEPSIRIGLLTVDNETQNQVQVTSVDSAWKLEVDGGEVLAELKAGEDVIAFWSGGTYYYGINGGPGVAAPGVLRFVPESSESVMKVMNFDRRVTRGQSFAGNTYRGILEIRHSEAKDNVWLINELPVELYLRGLAETSNHSPMEYQKTMATAARSFAYFYLVNPNGARQAEGFDLTSYSTDQVYQGYEKESRMPRFEEAVRETAGQTVYFNDAPAITPYFSQSNGYTKDWSQVWWGNREYSKGVAVPCDLGKVLRGHGVGISATGAICMAEEGMTSNEILNHFFTGIEVRQVW